MNNYVATLATVLNRGKTPVSFLDQLVAWANSAPDEIFAENPNPRDIYSTVVSTLGPWQSLKHRKASMMEVMRVHAGFESSWNWNEGVDTTNHHSLAHIEGEESGAWQVSFDSTFLSGDLQRFAWEKGIMGANDFIVAMKRDHPLAMEYVARLYRVSVAWAGPIKRHEIDAWLSRHAVAEFQTFLK